MRRPFAALAVALICLLGAAGGTSSGSHHATGLGATAFTDATAVARVAVVAVPAPQSPLPPLASFAVLAATASIGAALLYYAALRRRRPMFAPALGAVVRLRGPPAARDCIIPAP